MTKTITLMRPRRRWPRVVLVGALLVAIVGAGAWFVPDWLRYQENGLPRAVGADAIAPIVDAQERFLSANGRYATSATELESDENVGFSPPVDIAFRVDANAGGSAFVAGAVGPSGDYAVAIRGGGVSWDGVGKSFVEALANAGWTPKWASENGFDRLAETEHVYGAIGLSGDDLVTLRMDGVSGMYAVTVRAVPTSGDGQSWQEAVEDAGGDPSDFAVDGELTPVPVTVTSESGDSLTLVSDAEDGAARAMIVPAGVTTDLFVTPEEAVEAASAGAALEDLYASYRCATSTGSAGVDQVTVCQDIEGRLVVFASTGKVSSQPALDLALREVGATERWAQERGISLPGLDDLL